jgi:hypothetical protein
MERRGHGVYHVTFNNISVISWRSVLLVEETRVPGENHWPVANQWQTLWLIIGIKHCWLCQFKVVKNYDSWSMVYLTLAVLKFNIGCNENKNYKNQQDNQELKSNCIWNETIRKTTDMPQVTDKLYHIVYW